MGQVERGRRFVRALEDQETSAVADLECGVALGIAETERAVQVGDAVGDESVFTRFDLLFRFGAPGSGGA